MPEPSSSRSFQGPLVTLLLLASAAAFAQDKATPPSQQATTVLHASTQLVIVDVMVQDADGKPVHGLTRDNFKVVEGKTPQVTHNFEEHSSAAPSGPPAKKLQMPPGMFTDYTPVKPNSTLNIILLDSLNTPVADQGYVRDQLKKYVMQAPANAQIAIFGLSSRITLLQGFTSDPNVLRDAVEHKLTPHSSKLLNDPGSSGSAGSQDLSDMVHEVALETGSASLAETAANLATFETGASTSQLNLRIQQTLDAFEVLARYLSNYEGRKNLIWFSGSFPLDVLPDAAINNPFALSAVEKYREVSNLLTRARVAVYPVDARGLMPSPTIDPSRSGDTYARNPTSVTAESLAFASSQAQEHATMQQLAEDTGGRAFYNTNGLAQAVTETINSGSDYYTLVYSPTDHAQNGAFRTIHVELAGDAPHSLKLMYRHGYFADGAGKPSPHDVSATLSPAAAASTTAATNYERTALSRGAPTPSDVVFRVRVVPASAGTEDALAPGNNANPMLHGPYRRYMVDYTALANSFTWKIDANGHHVGEATFETLVFNPDGNLQNAASRTLQFNLPLETYNLLLKEGMNFHLEVSAPARGQSFLRVAIHDVPANRFGVVEIPTSSVSRLTPVSAPPTATPASVPPTGVGSSKPSSPPPGS